MINYVNRTAVQMTRVRAQGDAYDVVNHCVCLVCPLLSLLGHLSLVMRKPVFGVCDQVGHKPAGAATEAR